ncbi:MAG: prepilin-type N-terminal cleavage/methylation domain-containing protein [Ruminococcus sp.]|nr:prepilin-type N-terminal cleavage/methylation domain-containing protein [Ruminococcus sp.]
MRGVLFMKKLKKKRVKGMTLIEVIISLAIFTVLTAMMVEVGSVTKSLMMSTNHLTNKTTAESPIGAVRDVTGLQDAAKTVVVDPADAAQVDAAMGKTDLTVTVTSRGYTNDVAVTRYSTGAAAQMATANGTNCDTSKHMNGDLVFYDIH